MKIKQLEWIKDARGDFEASGFWGIFQVVQEYEAGPYTASLNDANSYEGFEEKDFETVEEAKAYCQSLLEKQAKDALEFVEPDCDCAWRRADNPPAKQGQYLTKIKDGDGEMSYSVSLYLPGFAWVVFRGYHHVVEWMPIPGSEE